MASVTQNILDVNIDCFSLRGARWDEIHKIVLSHQLIQQARDDFLACKITVDEYLELLELHKVNVDDYLGNVEDNLIVSGIKF